MTSARGNAASVPTPPKLDPPPRLARGALRVVALGGITEIGRNMTVYEFDGRLLIVDFAPHELESLREEHQHRRLGFSDDEIARWLADAGLAPDPPVALPPDTDGLTVTIWAATRPALAERHVA